MALVTKDSKNRVSLGNVSAEHFIREIDERGRIIFTPQVMVDMDVYENSVIKLNDADRDRFIAALTSPPKRNAALTKALHKHDKKHGKK
ncbi:MAG: DUF1778 domain-containing protein [Bdellovibrio sp.]|nr:DUF1778 domain-containing protein [Bdellovibrio sp.]